MIKKFLLLFTTVFIFFSLVENVSADTIIDINPGESRKGGPADCRVRGSCVANSNAIQSGLRISIHAVSDGRKIGKSVDFFASAPSNELHSSGMKSVSTKYSKSQYVKNNYSLPGFKDGVEYVSRSDIPKPFLNGKSNAVAVENYFRELSQRDASGKLINEDKIIDILTSLGILGDDSTANVPDTKRYIVNNMDKYYWVVEPVNSFRIAFEGQPIYTYFMTPTETALFLDKSKYTSPGTICFDGDIVYNNGMYCRIANIERYTHFNYPNAIYLKGTYPVLGFNNTGVKDSGKYKSDEIKKLGVGVGVMLMSFEKTCSDMSPSDSEFWPMCCDDQRAVAYTQLYKLHCQSGGGGDEYPCSESSLGIKTRLIGNCVSATQTKIVQTDNWNVCLFTGKVSSAELSISYCNVFCREEVETDLQNRYPTVKAGNHFTLDSMSITGMKECRAKIDLEGLDKARENAISQMRSAYDTLQYEKAMQKISYYKDGTCDGECIEYEECPSGYTLSGTSCQKDIFDEDGKKIGTDTKSAKCKRYRQYDYYKPTPSSVTYYDSYGRAKSASKSSYCSYSGSAYQSKLSSAQSSYNQASSTMERVIENIRNCAGWVESIRYNFSPNLSLEFEYLGERRITMNKDLSESRRVKYYTSSGLQTSKITVTKQKLVCPGDGGCSLSNVSNLPWNEVVATEVDKNVYYSLPVNTFRYVDKVNIQSKDTPSSNGLSYDIGYPNIPVHYLTKEGEYPIKLLYSNLGENGKFDSYLSTIQGYGVYECKYKVMMTEYTFVYRTIDLNNPFPGKNGSGRQVGANWQNNKNIISADTFNKAPMYKITLNSKAIKTIRDYNKQNPYDDFKMICENGSNCKSNFLRNEIRQYVSILEGSR